MASTQHKLSHRPAVRRWLLLICLMVFIHGSGADDKKEERVQVQREVKAGVYAKDFTTSPWMVNQAPFVVYRLAVAAISLSYLLSDLWSKCRNNQVLYWPTRYTHWGLTLLVLHFCWSAVLAYNYHVNPTFDRQAPLQWYHHVSRALYSAALAPSLAIAVLYWCVITRTGPGTVMKHGCNTFLAMIDVFISGYPLYISDAVYSIYLIAVYNIFIAWLWKVGLHSGDYYQPAVDFNKGVGRTISFMAQVALIVQPAFHLVFYALYCTREWMV
uniref:Rost1 n=1 Tax=Branchiostoma lanceolatum TaxID=7740 RepID=A0A2Z4FS85_BRALA|nr:rost1 [Branchiostoma lanceolatum]